jgi:hypothetical protein
MDAISIRIGYIKQVLEGLEKLNLNEQEKNVYERIKELYEQAYIEKISNIQMPERPKASVKTSATFERSQSGQDTLGEPIETSDIVISRKNRIRLSNEDKKRYTQKRSKDQYENKKSKEVKTTLEPTPKVGDVSTASKGKTLIPEPVFKVVKQPIKLTF